MPGLDGQKMSKSYDNTIGLREDPDSGREEDPDDADRPGARASRTDPGKPEKCPVWQFHLVYSDDETQGVGAKGLLAAPASAASNASSR